MSNDEKLDSISRKEFSKRYVYDQKHRQPLPIARLALTKNSMFRKLCFKLFILKGVHHSLSDEIYTINDIAQYFHIGRNSAYDLAHEPGFPAIRIGKQLRVPKDRLLLWMTAKTEFISNQSGKLAKETA